MWAKAGNLRKSMCGKRTSGQRKEQVDRSIKRTKKEIEEVREYKTPQSLDVNWRLRVRKRYKNVNLGEKFFKHIYAYNFLYFIIAFIINKELTRSNTSIFNKIPVNSLRNPLTNGMKHYAFIFQ